MGNIISITIIAIGIMLHLINHSMPPHVIAPTPILVHRPVSHPDPEIVRSVEAFDALEPHWNALVQRMAFPTPFLRWDWARRWWNHFAEGRRLAIGVLRDSEGVPIAIAPFVISQGDRSARRWMRHLTWISGVSEVMGERMDLMVPKGLEAELTPRLLRCLDALQTEWDTVWLPAIPTSSPNLPFITEALDRTGVGAQEVDSHPCRFTALPLDWADYAAQRSARWRRNLRNRWATFIDNYDGRRGLSGQDMPHAEAIDHLARLHSLNWPDGVSNFTKPRSWAFHRELALECLERGGAMLALLMVGERVVAAAYGLVKSGQFSLLQQGWDPEFKAISIGNMVVQWSLEAAAARGLHTYDTLSGDCRYKAEWCPDLQHTVDVETFHPESVRAHLFRIVRGLSRQAKSLFPAEPEVQT